MSHALILSVTALFLVPGFFMAFVPMLPALSYMLLVSVVYALFDRFLHLSYIELGILLAVTLLSVVVDHLAGILGAKYGGAHGKSLLWGLAGSIVGTFIAPLVGSLAGLFVGVAIGEFRVGKTKNKALTSASGALVGSLAGIAVNVCLAIVFIGLFISFAL
jgi:uncharacterized protein YqgC (DUF456 family)